MDFWSHKCKSFLRAQDEIELEIDTNVTVESQELIELQEPIQVENQVEVDRSVNIELDEGVWKSRTHFYIENYVETLLCSSQINKNQERQFVNFLNSNQVTHLDLSNAIISKELISLILKNCPNIIELNVDHTQFNSSAFEEIKAHINLIYVHAQDTCLSQAEHDQLQAILEEKIANNNLTPRILPKLTI